MALSFEKLAKQPDDWDDLIRHYGTKTLFHESAWLKHVQSIHPGARIDYFAISDGNVTVGYHCCLSIRKMGILIHGSPLGGTGTNYLGPLVSEDIDQRALVKGLTRLMGPMKYLQMELSHDWLAPEIMTEFGFETHKRLTHVVPLPESEDEAWNNLKGPARNRIRKAEKNKLEVEVTQDPEVVRHFFEQFIEVYGKQGMTTPFGLDRPQSLYDCLLSAGRLLPIWVKHDGRVIAAGLFPYDESCIYFWGAASWLEFQSLYPNELLQWYVIKCAVARGIPAYDMCGGNSQFKNKFGGEDIPHLAYSKSAFKALSIARQWYRRRHFKRLRKA